MKPLSVYIENRRQKIIAPYVTGRILDLGCGYGAFVGHNQPKPENYLGVDHLISIVQWFERQYPEYRVKIMDLESDFLEVESRFDTIVMTACLEHLKNPDHIFSQLPNILNQNGKILITTPTPFGGKIHTIGARFGFFYQEAAEDHEIFYYRETLQDLFSRHGLKMVEYSQFMFGGNQFAVGMLP